MTIFRPASFARFITDLRNGGAVIPPARLVEDPFVTPSGLTDLAEAMGVYRFTAADFELDDPNPLATGHHCPTCLTRLDKADRPCPFAPHEEN